MKLKYPECLSVVAALSWCFAILVNKFCKIMKIFEQLDYLRNRWVLCQHLEIRAAVPEIFNQLSNQLCELPTELVKYLKNCYSDR
jgi:hypothetical protein